MFLILTVDFRVQRYNFFPISPTYSKTNNPHISHICYNHLQYRWLQSCVSRIYLAFTSQQPSFRAFSWPFGSFFPAFDSLKTVTTGHNFSNRSPRKGKFSREFTRKVAPMHTFSAFKPPNSLENFRAGSLYSLLSDLSSMVFRLSKTPPRLPFLPNFRMCCEVNAR